MIDRALRELISADPARDLDAECDERLLASILAGEQPASKRSRPRFLPLIAAAALAVGMVVLVLGGNEATKPQVPAVGNLELAARAYALTEPQPGKILHTVVTHTNERVRPSGEVIGGSTSRVEQWHRGRQSHTLSRATGEDIPGGQDAYDHVVRDGVMRQVTLNGEYRIVRAEDNADSARVIREEQRGFLDEFRRRYEQGELDPDGEVTFAGRPAQRYLYTQIVKAVDTEGKVLSREPGPTTHFYVDRETGLPLGSTFGDAEGSYAIGPSGGRSFYRGRTTVESIEWLPPTRANLQDLRTFVLPRRYDGQGCLRGPSRERRSAPKLECGGTPGAPIR